MYGASRNLTKALVCGVFGSWGKIACSFSDSDKLDPEIEVFDVAVIGGGVVGLAVARACAVQTFAKTIVIEGEDVVGAGTSSRNSGLGCTGYDSPPGSLERQLLRRSIRLHQNLYRSFGLSHSHVQKCGSLVVAWTSEELEKLPRVLQENREAGDDEACLLSQAELRAMEPSLSHKALGAVFCPYEAVVEPWLVTMGYAENARINGVCMKTGTEVVDMNYNASASEWVVSTRSSSRQSLARSHPGKNHVYSVPNSRHYGQHNETSQGTKPIRAKVVINCAGLYGDKIEALLTNAGGGRKITSSHTGSTTESALVEAIPPFSIAPRKGQFIVYRLADEDKNVLSSNVIVEPVATEFTKGVIIWKTLYGNVVVGPTATNVSSPEDYGSDIETLTTLQLFGENVLPCLKRAEVVGCYTGLRPATEHRDYQIYPAVGTNGARWITVGGIRSTGLTASSGIGEYVAELYANVVSPGAVKSHASAGNQSQGKSNNDWWGSFFPRASQPPRLTNAPDGLVGISQCARNPLPLNEINRPLLPPYSNTVSRVSKSTVSRTEVLSNAQVPSLQKLSSSFSIANSGERFTGGTVDLFGRPHRVTHAISSFGMENMD